MNKKPFASRAAHCVFAASALTMLLVGCAHSSQGPASSTGSAASLAPTPSAVQPSARFDNLDLRRCTISKDDQGNIVAKLGIGVDVVGTLRVDPQSQLTYEQHPVVLRIPQPPQPLSPEDRASLGINLQRNLSSQSPPADPLWQQILTAAQK